MNNKYSSLSEFRGYQVEQIIIILSRENIMLEVKPWGDSSTVKMEWKIGKMPKKSSLLLNLKAAWLRGVQGCCSNTPLNLSLVWLLVVVSLQEGNLLSLALLVGDLVKMKMKMIALKYLPDNNIHNALSSELKFTKMTIWSSKSYIF